MTGPLNWLEVMMARSLRKVDDMSGVNNNLTVVRVQEQDVSSRSDRLHDLTNLLLENESRYPSIESWINEKVLTGIKSGEKAAFVGYRGDRPAVTAVIKRGERSKFCHLRIVDDLQDQGLGEMFFALMALEVKRFASEVHFTLPESLWDKKSTFFSSFGFNSVQLARKQYRRGEDELLCSASFESVWTATWSKLPRLARHFRSSGYQLNIPLMLSVRPAYAEAIFRGLKRFEIRRRFSNRWIGRRAAILATRPFGALLGEVTINSVRRVRPDIIWEQFGSVLGCSESELKEYCAGLDEAFVIGLSDITPYMSPVPVRQLEHLLSVDLQTPQSYSDLTQSSPWRDAVSLAALLHGNSSFAPRDVRQVSFDDVVLPHHTFPLFCPT